MIYLFLLLFILLSMPTRTITINKKTMCENENGFCAAGCWDVSTSNNDERKCVPVMPGFYSPRYDNKRYDCGRGTYSSIAKAMTCSKCPVGTYSKPRASECIVCPAGTYSNVTASGFCKLCDTTYFNKPGSNAVQVIKDEFYCDFLVPDKQEVHVSTKRPAPDVNPPRKSNSKDRQTSPSSAIHGTDEKNTSETSKTSTNNNFTIIKEKAGYEVACGAGTYVGHSACISCPTALLIILMPVLLLLVIFGLKAFLVKITPCYAAVLFIGFDYLQTLFLLGIARVPWTRVVTNAYKILSVFAFDINHAVPLQCYLGLSAQGDHVLVLIIPFLLWLCILTYTRVFRKQYFISQLYTKWLVIGLFLTYSKMILTSLEAMTCSSLRTQAFVDHEVDWFCASSKNTIDKISAAVGFLGFLLYGLVYPWWFIQNLNIALRERTETETVKQEQQHDGGDAQSTNTESTTTAIEKLEDWTRFFLQPFCPRFWWWSAFILFRKFTLVAIVFSLHNTPFLMLTFVLVFLTISELIQRFNPPYVDHNNIQVEDDEDISGGSHSRSATAKINKPHIFQFQTMAILMQASLIFVASSGVMFSAVPTSPDRRVGLSFFWLCTVIASIIYLLLAFYHYFHHSYNSGNAGDVDQRRVSNNSSPTTCIANGEKCGQLQTHAIVTPEIFVQVHHIEDAGPPHPSIDCFSSLDVRKPYLSKSSDSEIGASLMIPCKGSVDECNLDATPSGEEEFEDIVFDSQSDMEPCQEIHRRDQQSRLKMALSKADSIVSSSLKLPWKTQNVDEDANFWFALPLPIDMKRKHPQTMTTTTTIGDSVVTLKQDHELDNNSTDTNDDNQGNKINRKIHEEVTTIIQPLYPIEPSSWGFRSLNRQKPES